MRPVRTLFLLRGSWFLGLVSTLAVLSPGAARAQGSAAPPPHEGDHIRLEVGGVGELKKDAEGTLLKIEDDALFLSTDETVAKIPLRSVVKVEVRVGKKRHTIQGALLGAAAGVVPAAVLWSGFSDLSCQGPNEQPQACPKSPAAGAAVFAGGVVVGALLGHSVWKTDEWSEVPRPQVRVMIRPERNGGRLALQLAF